jgi:hypothetical protein
MQQARQFQVVWLNIFASQLDALGRMALEQKAVDVQEYFDAHVERVKNLPTPPAIPVTFDGWCGYLLRMSLMTIDQSLGTITQEGRDFLTFAKQQNLPRFQGL